MKNYIFQRLAKRLSEVNYLEKTVSLGEDCYVSGSKISGNVECGNRCKFYQVQIDGNVQIGRYTSIWGPNVMITSKINPIRIGSFCSIARNVSIQEYNHKIENPSSYHMNANIFGGDIKEDLHSKGSILIGHDVWIGAGAVILSGVEIGTGAIIGANSLVSKNVAPYSVVGGNPASKIKDRFDQEKVQELLEMAWWEWSIDKIVEQRAFFLNK